MKWYLIVTAVVSVSLVSAGALTQPQQDPVEADDGPAHSITEVMERVHEGGDALMRKVIRGIATDEEKQELLRLYIDMLDGKPPRGDEEEWKVAAGQVVVASARVVIGHDNALAELRTATNCVACHDRFR